MRIIKIIFILIVIMPLVCSCRDVEYVSFMTEEHTGMETKRPEFRGLYILNEGNMGSNKCTLDYLDLDRDSQNVGKYYRNIYGERNPNVVFELGDVGNDIAIYGSKLWMVINCSNKVEVCQASDAHRIGQINIPNCRYIGFDKGYAYISSYAGPVQIDSHCPLGMIYKVDTLSLLKTDSLIVGYQPEQMAINNGKLYVANSGGYRVPEYDNRFSVIDLDHFKVEKQVELGINLHHVLADRLGQIWISSRGDYQQVPSCLYWYENNSIGKIDISVSSMAIAGDSLFYIGSSFNYLTGGYACEYGIIDIQKHRKIETNLFEAKELKQIKIPYGVLVNPFERDFYIMDAKNFVSSGELVHFKADGTYDWKVKTGDIPSCGAFFYK